MRREENITKSIDIIDSTKLAVFSIYSMFIRIFRPAINLVTKGDNDISIALLQKCPSHGISKFLLEIMGPLGDFETIIRTRNTILSKGNNASMEIASNIINKDAEEGIAVDMAVRTVNEGSATDQQLDKEEMTLFM
ncbi:hypothetical protein BB560_002865 [Smittium megazygosporum]|uniref:Uncharacterized protein n=1 Tax=Smittium megazygosporum TaxID=133381 RepID=A0A2T9ZDK7_9FUNG|nr:hypothetical protein BB560_002865 [Smittium megazygosporum]